MQATVGARAIGAKGLGKAVYSVSDLRVTSMQYCGLLTNNRHVAEETQQARRTGTYM